MYTLMYISPYINGFIYELGQSDVLDLFKRLFWMLTKYYND